MTLNRFSRTVLLTALLGAMLVLPARAAIVFDDAFNFREIRENPPLNWTQGPDLLILGLEVIDTDTGIAPAGAIVGAENLLTGEKFFMRADSAVDFSLTIPYTPERARGRWIAGVTSDVGSASALLPVFGTGPGTDAIPPVENFSATAGAQPVFSWDLPAGLATLNDGNIDRLRARIFDSNGTRFLNATVDSVPLSLTSINIGPGVITHNGAFVGQILLEGFDPFNRSAAFDIFLVDDAGSGGTSVRHDRFFYRDHRRANSVRFGEGDLIVLGTEVAPFTNTYVHAEHDSLLVSLSQAREANRKFEFASDIEFDSDLTGPWTIVAWNGAVESVARTHSIEDAELLPFVDNIRMLPNNLTPTLEWDLPPEGSTDFVSVQIGLFDDVTDDRISAFGPGQDQLFETLPVDATSYTFAAGALEAGRKYVVRILLRSRDAVGNTISRSLTFFNFSPIMETSTTPVYLPSLDAGGVYNFDFDVRAGFPVTIDPHVALGYDYAIGDGNPRFASVSLPPAGDDRFELVVLDDSGSPLRTVLLEANETFAFTTVDASGVTRFRVLGIEESAGLDPSDPIAFMTTVTFVADGEFTGTMTPLTEPDRSPGDLNGDGCVDRADYTLLVSDVRSPEPNEPTYDINADGRVNRADVRALIGLFSNRRGAACG